MPYNAQTYPFPVQPPAQLGDSLGGHTAVQIPYQATDIETYDAPNGLGSDLSVTGIAYGRGVVQSILNSAACRYPIPSQVTLTFVGDLITDNLIDLDVNGVAMAQVTFAVSNANTLALIAAALENMTDLVLSASVDGDHSIVVVGKPDVALIMSNILVTAGVSQTTGTGLQQCVDDFLGAVVRAATQMVPIGGGASLYNAGDMLPVGVKDTVAVYSEQAVTTGSPVFLRFLNNGAGKIVGQFRVDADSNTAFQVYGARWLANAAAGICQLTINLPQ